MPNPLVVTVKAEKLDRLSNRLEDKLRDVVKVAAFNVERRAKEVPPPIDTGATMNSIHVTISGGGGNYSQRAAEARRARPGVNLNPEHQPLGIERAGLVARIGPSTSYAPALEFGSHNMPARPFMSPSLEAERGAFIQAVKHIFREAGRG